MYIRRRDDDGSTTFSFRRGFRVFDGNIDNTNIRRYRFITNRKIHYNITLKMKNI